MNLYWLEECGFRLAIMARPRGGDWLADDVGFLKKIGVEVVVSTLTAEESEELDLLEELTACESQGLTFRNFRIKDRSVPENLHAFREFLNKLVGDAREGRAIVIHCRAGIGRSSLVAACLLTVLGISTGEALQLLEEARKCPVPDTPEQRDWIMAFHD
jgi:protein-tyrosine phosphatase